MEEGILTVTGCFHMKGNCNISLKLIFLNFLILHKESIEMSQNFTIFFFISGRIGVSVLRKIYFRPLVCESVCSFIRIFLLTEYLKNGMGYRLQIWYEVSNRANLLTLYLQDHLKTWNLELSWTELMKLLVRIHKFVRLYVPPKQILDIFRSLKSRGLKFHVWLTWVLKWSHRKFGGYELVVCLFGRRRTYLVIASPKTVRYKSLKFGILVTHRRCKSMHSFSNPIDSK